MRGADERSEYLRRAPASLGRLDAAPLAYGLMSNHVHWALRTGEAPPAALFHSLHGGFAGWLNRRTGRLGPAFAGRFTDVLCATERCATLLAYVHNNPVRAGLVSDPSACDWTSHRAYLGLAAPPPWLDVELGLALSGFDATPAGRARFHDFVLSRATGQRDPLLSGTDEEESRRRARRATGAQCEVGASVLSGEQAVGERQLVTLTDAVVRPRWPGSPLAVVERVAARTGVSAEEMRSRCRRRVVVEARRAALWMWGRSLGRALCEMNSVLGLSSGAGSLLLRTQPQRVGGEFERMVEEAWAPFRSGGAGGQGATERG